MAYMLVVEWDGAHPPTTWYNKLHRMDLWVRPRHNAEAGESTLQARRRNWSNGLVLQEGVIIVNNEADLEELVRSARHLGARTVLAGIASIEQSADRGDMDAVAAVEPADGAAKVVSNGKKHQLTCLEEMVTFDIDNRVGNCPYCRTSNIILRPNAIRARVNPYPLKAVSMMDFFIAARFWKGPNTDPSYEFNVFDESLPGPDKMDFQTARVAALRGDPALARLRDSTLYSSVVSYYVKTGKDDVALRLLDRGYIYLRVAQNLSAAVLAAQGVTRLMAFTEYTQAGGTRAYPLSHGPEEVDLLDLWSKERDIVLSM